nr:transcription initiation factor TFIID subunit 15-like isoform X2 [Tanacetum cinerariifolium]
MGLGFAVGVCFNCEFFFVVAITYEPRVCKSKYKEAKLMIRFKSPIQAIDSLIKDESDLDINETGGMGGGCGDTSGNAPPKAWQKDGDYTCVN